MMASLVRILRSVFKMKAPGGMARNWLSIDPAGRRLLEESVTNSFLQKKRSHSFDSLDDYTRSELFRSDLLDHVDGRLAGFRNSVVPWLNHTIPLKGCKLLEIGCGTGCSTLALCEQGARVTGIDVDVQGLVVAKDRARIYGIEPTLIELNASEVKSYFAHSRFDCVVFFAALEHMTIGERIQSIRGAWHILNSGGYLVVIETPNRLWNYDLHTSLLPFFHWLPDSLAKMYLERSPRPEYVNEMQRQACDDLAFYRWGRGVSYHEFEVAIGSESVGSVVSHLVEYNRSRGIVGRMRYLFSSKRGQLKQLRKCRKDLSEAWFYHNLYLILRKLA